MGQGDALRRLFGPLGRESAPGLGADECGNPRPEVDVSSVVADEEHVVSPGLSTRTTILVIPSGARMSRAAWRMRGQSSSGMGAAET